MSEVAVSTGVPGVEIHGSMGPRYEEILNPETLAFLADLHRKFNPSRLRLLKRREERQKALDAGALPDFLPETADVRAGDWKVAPIPADLQDRRVEITGPTDRKMVINALNSGAKVFMADFEDANSPTWSNQVEGQINIKDRWAGKIDFTDPVSGKDYKLSAKPAVLLIRPRGWHLPEEHLTVDGEPISGGLFDLGLYVFLNAKAALAAGSGPYFYLPKLESHLEARLWNEVFVHAQQAGRSVHDNGEECDQEHDDEARHVAGAEPDHQHRGDRDGRDRLRHRQQRKQGAREEARMRRYRGQKDAARRRDREADHHLAQCRQQVDQQPVGHFGDLLRDDQRRGQQEFLDLEHVARRLPQQQQRHEEQGGQQAVEYGAHGRAAAGRRRAGPPLAAISRTDWSRAWRPPRAPSGRHTRPGASGWTPISPPSSRRSRPCALRACPSARSPAAIAASAYPSRFRCAWRPPPPLRRHA
ncbi:MAG: hypothetical protein KIT16_11290 [Rhodospirillaceae bacterium]|nr:hypothetical protein [Rhodospirillaceae bacterium]